MGPDRIWIRTAKFWPWKNARQLYYKKMLFNVIYIRTECNTNKQNVYFHKNEKYPQKAPQIAVQLAKYLQLVT